MATEECPFCGGTDGYYHKSINRLTQYNGWDGSAVDCDTDLLRGGKREYCQGCNRDVTKYVRAT